MCLPLASFHHHPTTTAAHCLEGMSDLQMKSLTGVAVSKPFILAGCMDCAVRASERAAKEVLVTMGKIAAEEIHQREPPCPLQTDDISKMASFCARVSYYSCYSGNKIRGWHFFKPHLVDFILINK